MRLFNNKMVVMMGAAFLAAAIVACTKDNPVEKPEPGPEVPEVPEVPKAGYDELYRPQIHFTPARNWMNDPNGMVYADGVYHLFYQYNPQANVWGNMSWGHATSKDLFHWEERPVALTRDDLGDIFSGSAVIDKNNTAGFGANALVALYTSAGSAQQQSLAYSTDGAQSFTRYSGNPVIRNNDDNLRDPKVFWHEASGKWIMALAKGWKMGVEFYGSADLKTWNHLSTFFVELPGRPSLQWECPDLFPLPYKGGQKWVLIVSVNPGGPVLGSGTMYFVGDFDGTAFKADKRDYPLWMDYGMDNYAGVTWSNTGDRCLLIGWMNNWSYAGDVPCSPWRSAMTLPRELSLQEHGGVPCLASPVAKEVDGIAKSWQKAGEVLAVKDAYQLQVKLGLGSNSTITLSNDEGDKFVVEIYAGSRMLAVKRNGSTGITSFNGTFSLPSIQAPLLTEGDKLTLNLFVDQSSVELFNAHGTLSMTNLVFPKSLYTRLKVDGNLENAQVRELKRIWE